MNLKDRINQKLALMNDKKHHEGIIKSLKEQIDEVDQAIMAQMDEAGIDQARVDDTTVFIQKANVPTVEDWDVLNSYILENQALHLLERRVGVRAWREMFETGELVPGTQPFEKVTLGKRTS